MSDSPTATHVVTDRDRIETLAERHGAGPREVGGGEGFRIEQVPPNAEDRATWADFFEWFDGVDQVVRYRPPGEGDDEEVDFEILGRQGGPDAAGADDPPVDTESLATSDTGEDEPPVQNPEEDEPISAESPDDPSNAPTADEARGPTAAADALVLDEVHTAHTGIGDDYDDEFLRLRNDGDDPLDVSGWVVRNDEGREYRFPADTVLGAGEQVTLHTGSGADGERELHWGADESVWSRRDTVTVETPAGDAVLRVPYES